MQTLVVKRYTDCADERLLQMINQQDAEALELLYDRHAPAVFGLLLRVTRNVESAEELLQDTFWQVWQKAEQYKGTGTVAAWLLRIARNKALDELRRQRSRLLSHCATLDAFEHLSQPDYEQLEYQVEQVWSRQYIAQALEHIPLEQRLCLELVYFGGLSHREIAEQTNTPLGTVKTRVRVGLDKVERMLRGVGYA
jgi:RNA polymerase sigma-70 factor (ECF subfamily)